MEKKKQKTIKIKDNSKIKTTDIQELNNQVVKLTNEISRLRQSNFNETYKNPYLFILLNFFVGLLRGFGYIVGATIVVALLFYILSKITLIPIFGDFIKYLIKYLNDTTSLDIPL